MVDLRCHLILIVNLGNYPDALQHLDLIFESDMTFHGISDVLEFYKQESALDFRGHALGGCFVSPYTPSLGYRGFYVKNLENLSLLAPPPLPAPLKDPVLFARGFGSGHGVGWSYQGGC